MIFMVSTLTRVTPWGTPHHFAVAGVLERYKFPKRVIGEAHLLRITLWKTNADDFRTSLKRRMPQGNGAPRMFEPALENRALFIFRFESNMP